MLFDEVHFLRLVQGSHTGHRFVHHPDQIGIHIPEQTRNAKGYIQSGTAQFFQWDRFHSQNPGGFTQINGAHTHQVQAFRKILTTSFQGVACPDHHGNALRIALLSVLILLKHLLCQLAADLPGCPGGDLVGIAGVEVPTGWKNRYIAPGGVAP